MVNDGYCARSHRTTQLARSRVRSAWLFLMPALIALAAVGLWPLARTLWFSLTDAYLGSAEGARFIGLDNYLLLVGDAEWWNAVWNTVIFAACSVFLETLLGLMFALVLNAEFRGRALVRAAVLVPWAIPTVVSAKMWAWMYHDQYGVLNAILLALGIIETPISWLANPNLAMAAVIATDVWKTTPFMALLILAGLQTVPQELYEAARLDGVHPLKVLFRITLPLIKPVVLVAVIFRTLDALRIFDLIYVMTSNSRETASVSIFARQQLVDFADVGYGSAASCLIFLMIAGFTLLYLQLGRLHSSLSPTGSLALTGAIVSRKFLLRKTALYLPTGIILIYSLFPFYWAAVSSLKTGSAIFQADFIPERPAWGNYVEIFAEQPFGHSIVNSIVVSSSTVALSLLLSVAAAYALGRVDFRGRGLLLVVILSVSMFPQVAVLSGMFELITTFGLYNNLGALVLSYLIFTLPFTVWVLTTFMRALPKEIEEAALIDGASPWILITRIFLPMIGPAVASTTLLACLVAWNEFLFALTFTLTNEMRTVPVAIALISGASQQEIPWGNIMAASVTVTAPLILVVVFFQRRIVSGLTAGAVKG